MNAKLDERLAALASYVRPGAVVADVGCDHGYLAAHLILSGLSPQVYATDINPQPLQRARETVRRCGAQDKVTLLLTDGLYGVPPQAEDIVVAGMGGELIISILDAAEWVRTRGKRLILQPMSFANKLRAYLTSNGFELLAETPVIDGRHAYCVLCAEYTGETRALTEYESIVGRMGESDHPLAGEYLRRQYRKYETILRGVERSNDRRGVEGFRALVGQLEKWKG